ncbi:MAG: ABC-type transport auxiliary lipoprotein family protein [Syntrophaceae bacterium]
MREKFVFISVLIFLAAGCTSGKILRTMEYYMLDYASPGSKEGARLEEVLKVERFSVAQIFNSNAMLYKTDSLAIKTYPHNLWRANPGDLVTDFLIRDLRHSGLFRAVFSYRDPETTRFILEGNVVEFLEVRYKDNRKALLTICITLLDMNQKEIPKKIIFQKNYSYTAQCKEKGPEGLARGLSESMEHLSGQITSDVYRTIRPLNLQ